MSRFRQRPVRKLRGANPSSVQQGTQRSGVHWTVHLLGIAGICAVLLAVSSLVSSTPGPLGITLFDLFLGLGEAALAVYLVFRSRP